MAARPCSPNDSFVSLDVDAGEFIRYEVRFRGATANFTIEDSIDGTIIDDQMGPQEGPFVAEWPEVGQSVDRGIHLHTFSGIFLAAAEYRLKAKHCRESGSTKKVLKDCRWVVGEHRPITSIDVNVKEEA